MEDAARAEISRAQIWQWIKNGAQLDDGRKATREMYQQIRDQEIVKIGTGLRREAAEILDGLILSDEFTDFLTLPAYRHLESSPTTPPFPLILRLASRHL